MPFVDVRHSDDVSCVVEDSVKLDKSATEMNQSNSIIGTKKFKLDLLPLFTARSIHNFILVDELIFLLWRQLVSVDAVELHRQSLLVRVIANAEVLLEVDNHVLDGLRGQTCFHIAIYFNAPFPSHPL